MKYDWNQSLLSKVMMNRTLSFMFGKILCFLLQGKSTQNHWCSYISIKTSDQAQFRVRNLWSAARIHLDSCQIIHENLWFFLIQCVCKITYFARIYLDSHKIVQENLCKNGFSDSHQISNPAILGSMLYYFWMRIDICDPLQRNQP